MGDQRKPAQQVQSDRTSGERVLQRKPGEALARAAVRPEAAGEAPPIVHEVLRSPGQPLDADTRAFMEPRFGRDFGDVRVHTDGRAAESAGAVGALAYTVGRDVVFGAGQHAPGTDAGRRLMAHELTHVVQQRLQRWVGQTLGVVTADQPAETQAALNTGLASSVAQSPVQLSETCLVLARQQLVTPRVEPYPRRPMRLPRGPKRPDNPFEREPQEINDEDVKPEGKDFLPHFERYAPPTEDWDEIQERTRQQREMEGIVQEAERPIATLQRGGRPPDFVTVESEGTLIGELGALRHRIRNFHVLDAIEYEVNKATGPDDLRRIVDKYIYAQPGVYNPNELIVVSEKPKFPPNLDPEGELRWKIYNEAVERLAKKKPVIVENTTLVAPAVDVESDKQGKKRRRRCDNKPSVIPLPISWPGELPRPYYSPRTLIRTSKGDREFEGTDRGVEQRKFADEIKYAREKGVPPPDPFYPRDSYENSPFDAHHIHPLYLGGEDARFNLCALRTDLHQIGHPRLDDQESWLEEYLEQGICYGHLKDHPIGQTYTIRKRK